MSGTPGTALLNYLEDTVPAPFTYADLKHRYNPPVDHLPQTFAALTGKTYDQAVDGSSPIRETTYTDYMIEDLFEGKEHLMDALTGLYDHLNETDSWYLTKSFRSSYSDRDVYADAVDAFDEHTIDDLAEMDAISKHGGIAIITDTGWRAIYHALYQDPDRDEALYTIDGYSTRDDGAARRQPLHGQ